MWGNGVVQVDEILATFATTIFLDKGKEKIIDAIRDNVRFKFQWRSASDPNFLQTFAASLAMKGEYIIGDMTALCVYERSSKDKVDIINYLLGERNSFAAMQAISKLGENCMSLLPEDIKAIITNGFYQVPSGSSLV